VCSKSLKRRISQALSELRFLGKNIQHQRAQIVRAAIRSCSRNHTCAGSVVSRGCQAMKYGKALISRGGSTTRIRAIGAVICANLRGTVRIKSVWAMAKIAGTKNRRLSAELGSRTECFQSFKWCFNRLMLVRSRHSGANVSPRMAVPLSPPLAFSGPRRAVN